MLGELWYQRQLWTPALHCLSPQSQKAPEVPVRCPPLAVLIDFQQELRRVNGGRGIGIQQELLVLGQVLGRGLLGQAGAVQEFPLQQGQVCLWPGEREAATRC